MFTRFLDPQNEIAFKKIFGSEKNKDILITLLNEVLKKQLKSPIKNVTFLSPIQEPEVLPKKQSIVDVLCRDEKGAQYIIEMQVAHSAGFEERAQYYAAKAFISQMNKDGSQEDIKEVIFLAFTNFPIFPQKASYKNEQLILDKKTLENDLGKFSFTFIPFGYQDTQPHCL